MHRTFACLVLLLFTIGGVPRISATAASVRGGSPSTTDRTLEASTDRYLAPLIDLDLFQGVVLIARGERVLLRKGYGDANVELGVRNTPERVFRIASLSKPFTEVALGTLVEQGKLAWTDPLSKYVPGFPQGDRITIDMLVEHRAGIPNMNSLPYDEESRSENSLDSLVRAIAQHPLDYEPGSRTRYSNGGYALLAAVIEKVSGTSYPEYLERAVLTPLKLTHTRHERNDMVVPGRAYGYMPSPARRGERVVAPFQQMDTKTGGGSLVSTADDLFRFLRAAYQDNVVKRATWEKLFPSSDSLLSFQGRCPGYNLVMRRELGSDVTVIVLANNYAAGMVADIARDLTSLARGGHPAQPAWRGGLTTDAAFASRWTGRYRAPAAAPLPYGDVFDLVWQNGDLVVANDGAARDVLLPQGEGKFLMRILWSEVRLGDGADGKPVATVRPLWFKTDPVVLTREK